MGVVGWGIRGRDWHAEGSQYCWPTIEEPLTKWEELDGLDGFHRPLWGLSRPGAGWKHAMMYPQAQRVVNIWGLKQDPILTHLVLKEKKKTDLNGYCVLVCVRPFLLHSCSGLYTEDTGKGLKFYLESTCSVHVELVNCCWSSHSLELNANLVSFLHNTANSALLTLLETQPHLRKETQTDK